MASAAALKMAAICMLVMCVGFGSQMIVHALPDQDAAAGALLQDLMEHELAEKLGLNADNVGDNCPQACENCLVVCAIKCVLNSNPVACFADCIVKEACLTKTMVANNLRGRPQGWPSGGGAQFPFSCQLVIDCDN